MNKSHILQAFTETPWAILPNKLAALCDVVDRHISGEKLTAEEIEARIHGATRPQNRRTGSVAILPLFGTVFPRANLMTDMSGATSAERFGAQFAELLENPDVGTIVLDINSPGGQVNGVQEVADRIFAARGKKPIIAVANHLMASAAYWIGSAADEIVVTPSADIGSIGVFAVHTDLSVAYDMAGIKVSLISEGKHKTEGNPYEPLSEEARAGIQARVTETYDAFVEAVARHRGVATEDVRGGYGEGRVVGAREAVRLGMADRIATLEEVVTGLLTPSGSTASRGAVATETPEGGQAPAPVHVHVQEAQARLAQVGNRTIEGENSMYLRELLKARAAIMERATAIVTAADQDARDLTDEERAEFEQLLGQGDEPGQVGVLDAKIEQVQAEREKLRAAAEKKFTAAVTEAEKPEAVAAPNSMKRADFNKLDSAAQGRFVAGGGKVED